MTEKFALIGFASQATALLLANYMRRQGIQVDVVAGSNEGEYIIQLVDPADVEAAQQIAKEFIQQPRNPKYQDAAWDASERVQLKASTQTTLPNLQTIKQAPFTSFVAVLCCVVYALSLLDGYAFASEWLMILPWSQLSDTGQWWRLIGPAFIHFSVLHIVFNLLWWWVLGKQIENGLGIVFLLILFTISALVSNIAQLWVAGPNFGGLSGVVYALMGFVWWLGWLRPQWGIALSNSIIGFMLVWLVLGYADVLWVNMANTAHTVGLISGCLMAWVVVLISPQANKSR